MALTAPLSILWIGLLLGVSFLATPVKFRAPTLSLPTALDVGRVTFSYFARVEAVVGLALLATAFDFSDGLFRGDAIVLSAISVGVVGFQSLWVRPVLDRRAQVIIDGGDQPRSRAHTLYIALEILKLACLTWIAFSA